MVVVPVDRVRVLARRLRAVGAFDTEGINFIELKRIFLNNFIAL